MSVDGVWRDILDDAGVPASTTLQAAGGIDNQTILEVIGSTCRTLDVSLEQAAEDFGHHWVNEFAPRTMDNTHPPRFDYKEPSSPESSPS